MSEHVKKGIVMSFKPVVLKNGTTKFITTFAVENDEFQGGVEYVTLWIHKQPYCRQEWRLFCYNFKWNAIEPMEQ